MPGAEEKVPDWKKKLYAVKGEDPEKPKAKAGTQEDDTNDEIDEFYHQDATWNSRKSGKNSRRAKKSK